MPFPSTLKTASRPSDCGRVSGGRFFRGGFGEQAAIDALGSLFDKSSLLTGDTLFRVIVNIKGQKEWGWTDAVRSSGAGTPFPRPPLFLHDWRGRQGTPGNRRGRRVDP